MEKLTKGYPRHLAWHETLEMHELVAFQSAQLVAFKKKLPMVKDPALRALYGETIQCVENNIRELLQYYPHAPKPGYSRDDHEFTAVESIQLLGFAKTAVRYYAIAITETATPQLRETLHKQLNILIALHAKAFYFMYERSYYPSYNLEQLLANDVKVAHLALSL
ncbi:spore coat protein [Paenibacillus xerothermodurans]|uniref:Spore coat protein n=1 Tax=Paenibacillus xerothermodurans TaxID=1977292 RepID=A0A2W1N8W0_PAEXE|nr:spore coat protein [Paenibacillus xerothermodurans]PZE19571.1 spore coat protein [Paenibacillus xerothermodurans]